MAQFELFKNRGITFRRYVSDKRGDRYFVLDVNLRKNEFLLYFFDGEIKHFYVELRNDPEKVLTDLGYCLDDFTNYESVIEFLDLVAETFKNGNKIRASLSDLFCFNHDIY